MKLNKKIVLRFLGKILLVLLGISFVVGLVIFLNSPFFKIKKVDCFLGNQPCEPEIRLDVLSNTLGKNWLFFSPKKIITKNAQVKKIFPDSLVISFSKKEPVAAMSLDGGELVIIDEEGKIVKEASSSGLPIIKNASRETVGWISSFLKELKLRSFRAMTITVTNPKNIIFVFEDGLEAIFSSKKEKLSQLDSLQLIFSRAKIEGKKIAKIDLRFDKPIVSYE